MNDFRIDPDRLIDTQQRMIGEQAKRQAKYAAAVDQLLEENRALRHRISELEEPSVGVEGPTLQEVEEASG